LIFACQLGLCLRQRPTPTPPTRRDVRLC
jgi:hypothetical protein